MKKTVLYTILVGLLLPVVVNAQGFFLNDWEPKSITAGAYNDVGKPTATATVTMSINAGDTVTKISKYMFGNNSNLWMTQTVTEPSLINHITNLNIKPIRGPGGSISDVYFWNSLNNQPPADAPDSLMNENGVKSKASWWYGKNTDSWTLSLDNYYSMLQQTGSAGILVVNYGYARYGRSANPVAAAAHLAANWVRYDNGRTKFWEIGNENFGGWEGGYRIDVSKNLDGQPEIITGNLYGQHFKVFADSMKKAAQEIGKTIYIGAVLYDHAPASWETSTVKTWNSGVISQVNTAADFYIEHSYYTPYNTNSNATEVLNTATTVTLDVMNHVKSSVQAAGGTMKPVAMTEWNIFAVGSMQQVSHINGMHAGITLGELIKNKYGEATRWDLANAWENGNDHGMFNQGDEPGPGTVPKWNPRAPFYHMYYFQKYCGDKMVQSTVTGNSDVLGYATSFTSGQLGVALFNKGTSNQTVQLSFQNFTAGARYYWYTLTGSNDNGEFSRQVNVNGVAATHAGGGPLTYATINPNSAAADNNVKVTLPARSAVYMLVERGMTTPVNDIDPLDKLIKLLRNPAGADGFTLQFDGFSLADRFDISVSTAVGQIIHTTTAFNTRSLTVTKYLSPGMYLIRIETKKGVTIKKLIVN
jgi:enamine deaminase RidA (YjgF/YER057c/UK114 family)